MKSCIALGIAGIAATVATGCAPDGGSKEAGAEAVSGAPAPVGADESVVLDPKLDWLTAWPAEPALQHEGYLVVTPATRGITAHFATDVGLAPLFAAAGRDLRMRIDTLGGETVELVGDLGLTTARFDLAGATVPAGTTGSTTFVAGDEILDATGEALVFPFAGDANADGSFDSNDLVLVAQAGKYETGEPAGFSEGDFDGNGTFDAKDLVLAMQQGAYEQGPRLALPSAPAVLRKDFETYLDEELTYLDEKLPSPDEDGCRIVCALVGTEHRPDRSWESSHVGAPECWHDDKCVWWPGAEDFDPKVCAPPADADATLSGWWDGPSYQFSSCGLPENYVAPAYSTVSVSGTSSAHCKQSMNVKLVCDYLGCENSRRSCSFRAKGDVEGAVRGQWRRSAFELPSGGAYDGGRAHPETSGRLYVRLPGSTEAAEASLTYSPAGVSAQSSSGGGATPASPEGPGKAVCDEVWDLYAQGLLFFTCFYKFGQNLVVPNAGWECRIGFEAWLGSTQISLADLGACFEGWGNEPTGQPIGILLRADKSDADVGRAIDVEANGAGTRTLGPLFIESTLTIASESGITWAYDKVWKTWEATGHTSNAEGAAPVTATVRLEAAGDDPAHCILDAEPLRLRPWLSKKILAARELSLSCKTRSDLLRQGD
jgi:hypothetical protein